MTGIASNSQLRMSLLRYALITVPAVVLLGSLSGALSGSGADNAWYQALDKSPLNPPGWVFGVVWPILYAMLGLSLAMLLHAKGAANRTRALLLFGLQLALNLAWSPVFFSWQRPDLALSIIAAMLVATAVLILLAWRIRLLAGLLLYPYLGWLMFASVLNYEIVSRNPDAATLEAGPRTLDIQLNAI
jgi:translocator protein